MPKTIVLAVFLGGDLEEFHRYAEFDVLVLPRQREHLDQRMASQRIDHVADHDLRSRGAGRDTDDFDVAQPLRLDLAAIGDQVSGNAGFDAEFAQPVRVRAVLGAHHEDEIGQFGEL
jgi:hypothetical protein